MYYNSRNELFLRKSFTLINKEPKFKSKDSKSIKKTCSWDLKKFKSNYSNLNLEKNRCDYLKTSPKENLNKRRLFSKIKNPNQKFLLINSKKKNCLVKKESSKKKITIDTKSKELLLKLKKKENKITKDSFGKKMFLEKIKSIEQILNISNNKYLNKSQLVFLFNKINYIGEIDQNWDCTNEEDKKIINSFWDFFNKKNKVDFDKIIFFLTFYNFLKEEKMEFFCFRNKENKREENLNFQKVPSFTHNYLIKAFTFNNQEDNQLGNLNNNNFKETLTDLIYKKNQNDENSNKFCEDKFNQKDKVFNTLKNYQGKNNKDNEQNFKYKLEKILNDEKCEKNLNEDEIIKTPHVVKDNINLDFSKNKENLIEIRKIKIKKEFLTPKVKEKTESNKFSNSKKSFKVFKIENDQNLNLSNDLKNISLDNEINSNNKLVMKKNTIDSKNTISKSKEPISNKFIDYKIPTNSLLKIEEKFDEKKKINNKKKNSRTITAIINLENRQKTITFNFDEDLFEISKNFCSENNLNKDKFHKLFQILKEKRNSLINKKMIHN